MSLLKLTNYEGKPYSSGFSLSETKESPGLNFLSFKENNQAPIDKVSQVLLHVSLRFEKGRDCRVVYHFDDERLEPASILDPESYKTDSPESLIGQINISCIDFIFTGRAELEIESGEILPIDTMGYRMAVKEKEVIGKQQFETVTEDIDHEEDDIISFYPLGARVDSGKDIKKIEPAFFQILQHGAATLLKTSTASEIKEIGGLNSLDEFTYKDNTYAFKTERGLDYYQSLEDFVRSGGVKCVIEKSIKGKPSAAAAAAAAAASAPAASSVRKIEMESCEIYGTKLDDIVLGFKLVE